MSFNVGDLVAKVKLDTTDFKKGIDTAKGKTKNLTTETNKLTDGLKSMAGQALLAFGSFQVATKGIQFLKESSTAANEFEKAMITLEIISGKFGVSAEDAKEKAESLGKELRIGVGPAAESIQNLLKSGLNLDQAVDLMKRFTNEAITGKSANISLSQAVENLSFAYATGNSALGNMSGMSENWIDIIKNGKEALIEQGVAVEDITDDMAKYEGVIQLTNLTMGSAEKFTGTLIDKQADLSIKVNDLKVLVGDHLNPALATLVDWLAQLVQWTAEVIKWMVEHGDIIKAVAIAVTTLLIPAFISWAIAAASAAAATLLAILPITLLGIAIAALALLIIKNWDWIKEKTFAFIGAIKDIFGRLIESLKNFGNQIYEAITSPFTRAWERAKEIANKIRETISNAFNKDERNSPSIQDRLDQMKGAIDSTLDSIKVPDIRHDISAQLAGVGAGGNNVGGIVINMNGNIGSIGQAQKMGEAMGDQIIGKLKQNVRF